ncbi:ras-related protein Rab-13-like [Acanthaster planci]|uniref:Ras-related protein Rab-1 n=1 Tax=Acanthaster planci TaxID=133434 RepID=A0A8B7Y5G9_ACAPL|nr:ras-related protein Rab-13-like [Acanthaster planci]
MANKNGSECLDEDMQADLTFKILVLGDSSVGKTCLTCRFCENAFVGSSSTHAPVPTVGLDFKQRNVTLDDTKIQLQIWDTAGQERYRTLTTAYYRGAMGILVLFDITNETSFNHITSWLENISQNASPDVCKVLVGNKCDDEARRKVSTMRAINLASAFDLLFYETSAKMSVNVEPAFMALVKQMLTKQQHRLHRLQSTDKVIHGNRLEKFKKKEAKWCGC